MTQTYKVQVSMNQAHIVESGFVWKQGDFGFNIEIEVLDFDTTGATPQIIFRKSTGAVEATEISVAGNKFTYAIRGTELDTPGPGICDLKLKNSTTQRISTASFKYFTIPDTEDGLHDEASSYSDTIAQIIDEAKAEFNNNIAPDYSATATYNVGDYVIYNDLLYRCKTAINTAEAWTAAHWQVVTIGGDTSNLKSTLKIQYFEKNEIGNNSELGKLYPTSEKYYISSIIEIGTIALYEFYADNTYSKIATLNNGADDYYYVPANNVLYLRLYCENVTSATFAKAIIMDISFDSCSLSSILNQLYLSAYSVNTLLTTSSHLGVSKLQDLPKNKMYAISSNVTDVDIEDLPIYGNAATLISFSPRSSYSDNRNGVYIFATEKYNVYIGYQMTTSIRWQQVDNKMFDNLAGNVSYKELLFSTNKEITKFYPVIGNEYDVVLYGSDNISSIELYEFDTLGSYTRIKRVYSNELPYIYHYIPSDGTDYLRVYGKPVSGQNAFIRTAIFSNDSIISALQNRTNDYATDFMLSKEFAAVRKFTVIGDSMASGYYKESSSGTQYNRNISYSWPQIMAKMYGQVAQNASKSGADCTGWWEDSDGYCKAMVTSDNRSQIYIMGLGTNDYKDIPDDEITDAQIGSASDINILDYTQNADSFWGNYCKILQYVHDVAPDAKIICCTIPAPRPDTTWKQTAIRQICAYSLFTDYVVLCDLEKDYADMSDSVAMTSEMWQSHFTPAGYANSAEFLMYAFSKTIQKNLTMFINIPQIPYDLPVTEDYIKSLLTTYAETAVDIISTNTDNIVVNGKYVELDGVVYFSMILYYTNSINTGRNNIFTNFPAPDNTKVTFFELGESAEYLNTYLSYTSAWRINGAHLVGQVRRVFGKYQKSQQT